jgi:hypothetical protein
MALSSVGALSRDGKNRTNRTELICKGAARLRAGAHSLMALCRSREEFSNVDHRRLAKNDADAPNIQRRAVITITAWSQLPPQTRRVRNMSQM